MVRLQWKDGTSADSTALEKKGLDRKTNHKDLTKIEAEEIFVLSKSHGWRFETGGGKYEGGGTAKANETTSLEGQACDDQIRSQVKEKMRQRRVNGMARSLVLGVQGYDPRRSDEFYAPFQQSGRFI